MGGRSIAIGVVILGVVLVVIFALRRGTVPRNVVLISIDTLRADHLGCYGYHRDTSPNLDRLARDGAVFETAISSTSWTLPSHAALFTGLPDRVHGCTDEKKRLSPARETLAEAFAHAGHETAGFFSGPLLHPYFGLGQGFEHYEDCTSYPGRIDAIVSGKSFEEGVPELAYRDVTNGRVARAVQRWIGGRDDRPFFLFVHLWDVHGDYIPPAPFDTRYGPGGKPEVTPAEKDDLVALYDGEIRWTDDAIGRIVDALRGHGAFENTTIVVTADHGEAFWEHGFQSHRYTLHDEEVRIPLIVVDPSRARAGTRIPHVVSNIDVAPTILELAGLPPLAQALGRSRSLTPLLDDPGGPWTDRPVVSELSVPGVDRHHFAIRTAHWKLILDFAKGLPAVYDLDADPGELSPCEADAFPIDPERLAEIYRETVAGLDGARKWLASKAANPGEMPPHVRNRLRSLGYLR